MRYKRRLRIISCIVLTIIFSSTVLFGCRNEENNFKMNNGFAVCFINVGQGDCALIRFDDGKTLLIDCGQSVSEYYEKVVGVFSQFGVKKLDYMVLTHPDSDHVGNAYKILEDYGASKVYMPFIKNTSIFSAFERAIGVIKDKGCRVEYSQMASKIQGENYYVGFLSPISESESNTYYDEFNLLNNPTDQQVNNLSPMIYLSYKGVRFLFTGDADKLQEQKVLEYYKTQIINVFHKDKVNLYDIDFLKVAHHGDENSSSQPFLDILKPKNAVISVGGNNVYGHPSTRVINRITTTNENCKVLRTDVLGNVYVSVDKNGEYKISNQK